MVKSPAQAAATSVWAATAAELTELTAQQVIADVFPEHPPLRSVSFDIDLFPAAPPLISGTLTADSRKLMSGEQGGFISPRFEQLCRAQGVLRRALDQLERSEASVRTGGWAPVGESAS
jgi:hypothetical protein